jgi:hypothetical protein
MIQRIQSLWLLLASLAIFALFLFPSLQLHLADGAARSIKVTGVYETRAGQLVQTESFILLTIATVIVALLPLVVIFFYKDRKVQTLFCYLVIVILIGYGYWLARAAKGVPGNVISGIGDFGIGAILPSLSIIFVLLARNGIRNDEKLVRSADRLR